MSNRKVVDPDRRGDGEGAARTKRQETHKQNILCEINLFSIKGKTENSDTGRAEVMLTGNGTGRGTIY